MRTFRLPRKRLRDRRWSGTYVLDGSSYRRLAQRWKVSAATAWRRVQRSEASCVLGQVLWYTPPQALPVLLLDAKHVTFRHQAWTLYVAQDGATGRPLAWVLLPRQETRDGYDLLLAHLAEEGCRVLAVVSDGHKSILASVTDHLPRAVHQRCAAHVLIAASRTLGGKRFHATTGGKFLWRHLRAVALEPTTLHDAWTQLRACHRAYPELSRGLRVLAAALPGIFAFAERPDLPIPRTSNQLENLMGFLEQRLKPMRGMKTPETYLSFVTERFTRKFGRPTNL